VPQIPALNSPQQLLEAIHALPRHGALRILHLSGDQERVIAHAGIRAHLPEGVDLLAGPGCAATVCPPADIYQAIQLAQRHAVTLLVEENLLRLPIAAGMPGPRSLAEARALGADVRVISAPVEGILAAQAEPGREMVLFLAGFETLLAPLAGLLIEELPENLSLLLCGRDVGPLLERELRNGEPGFDALILPGNRCALLGSAGWESLVGSHRMPAAISGYTATAVLRALLAVIRQHSERRVGVDNCYFPMARPEGNRVARERLQRVFTRADGHWRGYGEVPGSAYRLQPAYRHCDADRRYPDYRGEPQPLASDMWAGCECAAVAMGRKRPGDCEQFSGPCHPHEPFGPCMASLDGTCHVNDRRRAAG
jgi:hydrogenase expression/formation protein HypD